MTKGVRKQPFEMGIKALKEMSWRVGLPCWSWLREPSDAFRVLEGDPQGLCEYNKDGGIKPAYDVSIEPTKS